MADSGNDILAFTLFSWGPTATTIYPGQQISRNIGSFQSSLQHNSLFHVFPLAPLDKLGGGMGYWRLSQDMMSLPWIISEHLTSWSIIVTDSFIPSELGILDKFYLLPIRNTTTGKNWWNTDAATNYCPPWRRHSASFMVNSLLFFRSSYIVSVPSEISELTL